MTVRAERAQQIGDRAAFGGLRWARAAYHVGSAVAAAVLRPHRALRHHRDLASKRSRRRRQKVRVGSEERDLGLDTASIRGNRAAQCRNGQMLRYWSDNVRVLRAADPSREGK